MNKETKNLIKKISTGVAVGAVVGLTLGATVGYNMQPEPVVKIVNHTIKVPFEVTKVVNHTIEVPVEVVKEVVVNHTVTVTDTELIQATCDRLLFDDIADCQKEVKAEDEALNTAWDYLLSQLDDKRFLEDELADNGFIADEDEFSVVKTFKDFEDVEVVKSNFDRDSYEFVLKVKVFDEEAEVKKYLLFNIEVEDSVADFIEVNEE